MRAVVAVVSVLAVLGLAPATPAAAAPGCTMSDTIPAPTVVPWPLTRLDPRTVWPVTRGEGVTVAVIDSGVTAQHEALTGNVLKGRDFGFPDKDGQCDVVGHGSVVAGIIAARDDPEVPFFGIAPKAKILPVRVLNTLEKNRDEELPKRIADAIEWAADQRGVKVMNLSLDTAPTEDLTAAVRYAVEEKDVVVVAAAGNQDQSQQGRTLPAFPAAYSKTIPGVLAVAGIKSDGTHVDSSVSGDYIDVAAPGLEIVGPAPSKDGYLFLKEGGTSFAAPFVSATAALIRAHHPDLTAAQVADRIRKTADHPPSGKNLQVGYGVVNPYSAVTTILGGRQAAPAPGRLTPADLSYDPLGTAKQVAGWSAFGGVLLVVLLFAARPVMRRGRAQGWKPRRAER